MSEPLTSDRAVTVMVYTRYEYRKVHARVHLLGETHLAAGGRVELVLFSQRSKEDRERRVIRGDRARGGLLRHQRDPLGLL